MNINGTLTNILEIILGVPQGSILGLILFKLFIDDFFYISKLLKLITTQMTTLFTYGDTAIEVTKSLEMGTEEVVSGFMSKDMSKMPVFTKPFFLERIKRALREFHS